MTTDLTISNELIQALAALEATTFQQAMDNLKDIDLTSVQRQAAIYFEQLKLINGPVEYSRERLKGELVARLDAGDFWQYHPSSPTSLDELVQGAGMSKSEKSDLLTWEKHIYPYLQEKLGLQPYQVWQMLNKTKRRRLTPYLRQLTDPSYETYSDKVRQAVEKLKEEGVENRGDHPGRDTQSASVSPVLDENLAAVEKLLTMAQDMTSSDIEEEMSVEPTPGLNMDATRHRVLVIDNDTGDVVEEQIKYTVVFEATEDQMLMLRRRFPDRLYLAIGNGDDIRITPSGQVIVKEDIQ